MLVLSRKIDQELIIGNNIRIKVLKVKGNTIRLGIEAPDSVRIVRGELSVKVNVPSEATITVVHSDPNGPTYSESEPAILPIRKLEMSKPNTDATTAASNGETSTPSSADENSLNRNDLLQQLVNKVAQRGKNAVIEELK